ncbi:MAG TPA: 50S ribosomal protein L25 [Vicinamibacterales bacterium]|nr:50S ribosomal protein L25 [Vicinamibacterales bacterium]HOQ61826.1 50S ribosomal protein L25 [Vicinamibacterales bacterium]HPK72790.1 50S ribosomal protein L25 [Vicinamibacterales bacterium]HPW21608.1 50S ribosomal protein L25 [Vicinamibacterales bacterium]
MEARLDAVKRVTFGKNEARRLRAKGQIPAVLYGGPATGGAPEATPIAVDPKRLMAILRGESGVNTLIGLTVDGEDVRVLMREYQVDPVTRRLLHADFYRIAMDRMITVTVPVTVTGEARGVKQQGGLLDIVHREVEVQCLPANIPEHIEIDVAELMLGQAIRLRDVATSPTWTPVTDPDVMLVHVIAPRAAAEPEPAEAAAAEAPAAAEPEVIKKGKPEKADEEQ